jgi:hypothetical protein
MSETKDLYAMSMEELKQLALEEDAKAQDSSQAKPDGQERARDENGRFVSDASQRDEIDNSGEADDKQDDQDEQKADAQDAAEEDGEPEEYIYKREIDLGDGSGVQVFYGKGATKEEALVALADKLADAQKNATKAINEFRRKHPQQPEKPKAKQWPPEEELILTQEFQTKPAEAFKKIYKEIFGESVEDAQLTLQQAKEAVAQQRSLAVQQNFVTTHPDYIGDPSNGEKIRSWVQAHGYSEFTEDNLEKAYQDLKKSGLLKLKSAGADDATETEVADKKRIASSGTDVTQQRSPKKGSTIKAGGRTAPVAKTGPTKDELYSMPLEKLRELADSQPARQE